ncbi:MAG TPA: hypothetical protein VJ840_12825 [Gemmatimonadaceae bacterium]|nr:hypothetical protein [Gemmatimonadaceae bacterium]
MKAVSKGSDAGMVSIRRRFSTAARLWILIAGFGQAAMPGIASIADASPSAASATAAIRPHIESHGSSKCPRVHQEDTCALCQFVNGAVACTPRHYVGCIGGVDAPAVAVSWQQRPAAAANRGPTLPRAPPVLA